MRARLTSLAISRAGAVAAVVAQSRLQRALPPALRIALLVGGSITIGCGVTITLSTGLGPGPYDLFVTALAGRVDVPISIALWAVTGVLAAVVFALGGRPGVGTAIAPAVIGVVIDVGLGLVTPLDVSRSSTAMELAGAGCLHLIGVVVIGLGAGALVVSGLGAGIGELLASATTDRLGGGDDRPGPSTAAVRTGLELGWVAAGIALGGPIGLGTVLVAATIGSAVRNGHRTVDHLVARVRAAGGRLAAGST